MYLLTYLHTGTYDVMFIARFIRQVSDFFLPMWFRTHFTD